MEMFKTNLNALSHHCRRTLIVNLVELKISTHYCVWKNKNMAYKIQSSLIESQHKQGIRIIFWSCPSVEQHRLQKMNDTNVAIQKSKHHIIFYSDRM